MMRAQPITKEPMMSLFDKICDALVAILVFAFMAFVIGAVAQREVHADTVTVITPDGALIVFEIDPYDGSALQITPPTPPQSDSAPSHKDTLPLPPDEPLLLPDLPPEWGVQPQRFAL